MLRDAENYVSTCRAYPPPGSLSGEMLTLAFGPLALGPRRVHLALMYRVVGVGPPIQAALLPNTTWSAPGLSPDWRTEGAGRLSGPRVVAPSLERKGGSVVQMYRS